MGGDRPGLLCVHAHPDDEAMTTGGVLAKAAGAGLRTAVVTCTGGELGQVRLPGRAEAPAAGVAALRRDELATALDLLGAGPPRWLGYGDSGWDGPAPPGSFWAAPFDQAVGRLVAELRAFRPAVVVTYDAFGLYGHRDHVQAHRVTLAAVEAARTPRLFAEAGPAWAVERLYLATVPLSLVELGIAELAARGLPALLGRPGAPALGWPDQDVRAVVDVRPWLERKWAALQAHRSQLGPGSVFGYLPEELRATALGTEWFLRPGHPCPGAAREDDLMAGLA